VETLGDHGVMTPAIVCSFAFAMIPADAPPVAYAHVDDASPVAFAPEIAPALPFHRPSPVMFHAPGYPGHAAPPAYSPPRIVLGMPAAACVGGRCVPAPIPRRRGFFRGR